MILFSSSEIKSSLVLVPRPATDFAPIFFILYHNLKNFINENQLNVIGERFAIKHNGLNQFIYTVVDREVEQLIEKSENDDNNFIYEKLSYIVFNKHCLFTII